MGCDEEQLRCVQHPKDEPLLVLAGPGSGKTHVLCHRIVSLLEMGVPERGICCVTFTTKAAREMQVRVATLLGRGHRCEIGTIHSLGFGIVREYAAALGYRAGVRTVDAADRRRMIQRAKEGLDLGSWSPKMLGDAVDRIKANGGRLPRNSDLGEGDARLVQNLERLAFAYNSFLKEDDMCDFIDMVVEPLKLLESNANIRTSRSARVRHMLIDEFQDTSSLQWQLLSFLIPGGAVTAVGDVDQGIYGFRGASPAIFRTLRERYSSLAVVQLARNYRSAAPIVAAAGTLIRHNRGGGEFEGGRTVLAPVIREDGRRRVVAAACVSEDSEVSLLVKQLSVLAKTGGSVGVLCRTNSPLGTVRAALKRAGLPFTQTTQTLSQNRAVQDVLAYLRVAADVEDEPGIDAVRRIANKPARSLPSGAAAAYLQQVLQRTGKKGCFAALQWAAAHQFPQLDTPPAAVPVQPARGPSLLNFAAFSGFESKAAHSFSASKRRAKDPAVPQVKFASGLKSLFMTVSTLRTAARQGVHKALEYLLHQSPYTDHWQKKKKAAAESAKAPAEDGEAVSEMDESGDDEAESAPQLETAPPSAAAPAPPAAAVAAGFVDVLEREARTHDRTAGEDTQSWADSLLAFCNHVCVPGWEEAVASELPHGGQRCHARITVSTVHAAKGLQFDYVFILRCNEHSFPGSRYRAVPRCFTPDSLAPYTDSYELAELIGQLKEERRLCYVAMTRAAKWLCISYAGGEERSRFVDEVIDGCGKLVHQWVEPRGPADRHEPIPILAAPLAPKPELVCAAATAACAVLRLTAAVASAARTSSLAVALAVVAAATPPPPLAPGAAAAAVTAAIAWLPVCCVSPQRSAAKRRRSPGPPAGAAAATRQKRSGRKPTAAAKAGPESLPKRVRSAPPPQSKRSRNQTRMDDFTAAAPQPRRGSDAAAAPEFHVGEACPVCATAPAPPVVAGPADLGDRCYCPDCGIEMDRWLEVRRKGQADRVPLVSCPEVLARMLKACCAAVPGVAADSPALEHLLQHGAGDVVWNLLWRHGAEQAEEKLRQACQPVPAP